MVEARGEDPPPRDEAEHRVVLGELLEVVARRLSLVNHRAQGHEAGNGEHLGDGEREVGEDRQRPLGRPPQQPQRRAVLLDLSLRLPILAAARLRHRRRGVEEHDLLLPLPGTGGDGPALRPAAANAAVTPLPRHVAGNTEPGETRGETG